MFHILHILLFFSIDPSSDANICSISNYLSLMAYATDTLIHLGADPEKETSDAMWAEDFRKLVKTARKTTHEMTSLLCLLSAGITNCQPLPPYLETPRPYSFDKKLDEIDKDILTIQHIADPGFAAFAVLQISARCIAGDMHRLLR